MPKRIPLAHVCSLPPVILSSSKIALALRCDAPLLTLSRVVAHPYVQGSYIASATKNIQDIYSAIVQSGKLQHPEDFRIGLIAFRDHPPQDNTYITRNFGFSSNPTHVQENLKTLYAAGGGDGPEAVTAALGDALEMDWRADASKMVVLIADAPPHGIGEYGDGESGVTLAVLHGLVLTNVRES